MKECGLWTRKTRLNLELGTLTLLRRARQRRGAAARRRPLRRAHPPQRFGQNRPSAAHQVALMDALFGDDTTKTFNKTIVGFSFGFCQSRNEK